MNRRRTRADGDQGDRRSARDSKHKVKLKKPLLPPTQPPANTTANTLITDQTKGSLLASLIPTRRDVFGKGIEDYVFDLIDLCRSTGIIKPVEPSSGDNNSSSSGYEDNTNVTDPFLRQNTKNNAIVYSCHVGTCPARGAECYEESCPYRQVVCTQDDCPSRNREGVLSGYCDDNNCYWRSHRFGKHRKDVLSRSWMKRNKTRNIEQDDRSEDSDDKTRLVYSKDWEKRREDKRSRKGRKRGKKRDEREWCDDTDDVSGSEEEDWESDETGVQQICRGAIDILKDLFVGPTLDDLVFSAIGEVGEWMSGAYSKRKDEDKDGDERKENKLDKREVKNKEDNKIDSHSSEIANGDERKPKGRKRNSEVEDWHRDRTPTNEQQCPNCHGNHCCSCQQSVVDILAKISEEMLNYAVPCLCEQDDGVGDHVCTVRENSSEELGTPETVPCQCADGDAQCCCSTEGREVQVGTLQHIVKALEECTGRSTSGQDDRLEVWNTQGHLGGTDYQCNCVQQNIECYCVTMPDNNRAQSLYNNGCCDNCSHCCNTCTHEKPSTSLGGNDVIETEGAQNLRRITIPFSCAVSTQVFLARPKSLDRSDRRYYFPHNSGECRPCNCSKRNGESRRRAKSLDLSTNGCQCSSKNIDIFKPCTCFDEVRASAVENRCCKCWESREVNQGTCYCPTQTSPVAAERQSSFGCESVPEENSDLSMEMSTSDELKSSQNVKHTLCSCSTTHGKESKSCRCSSVSSNNNVVKPVKKLCTCFSNFRDQTFLEKSHKPAENRACHCPKPAEDRLCHCPKPAEDTSCHCPKPSEEMSCHCPKPAEVKSCHCPKPAKVKSCNCPKTAEIKSCNCPKLAEERSCHCPKPSEEKSCHCPKPAKVKSCNCPKTAEIKSCHCLKLAEESSRRCPKPAQYKTCHCPKSDDDKSCHCSKPVEERSCHCPKSTVESSCYCPPILEAVCARCNCNTSPEDNQVTTKQNETRMICCKCLCPILNDAPCPLKSQDTDNVTEGQRYDANKPNDEKSKRPQEVDRSKKNKSKFSSKHSQHDDICPEDTSTEEDSENSDERPTEDVTNVVENLSESSVENIEFIDSIEKTEPERVSTPGGNRSSLDKQDNRNNKKKVRSKDPKNMKHETPPPRSRRGTAYVRGGQEDEDEDDSGSSLEDNSPTVNKTPSERKRTPTPKKRGSFNHHDDEHTEICDEDSVEDECGTQRYSSNKKDRRSNVVHKSVQTDISRASREGSVNRMNRRSRSLSRQMSDVHSKPEDSSSQGEIISTEVHEGSYSDIDIKRGSQRSKKEESHSTPKKRSGKIDRKSPKYETPQEEKKSNKVHGDIDTGVGKKSRRSSVRSVDERPQSSSEKRSSKRKEKSPKHEHLSEEKMSAVVNGDSNSDVVKRSQRDSVRREKDEPHSSRGKRSSKVEKRSSKDASPQKEKSNKVHDERDNDEGNKSYGSSVQSVHGKPRSSPRKESSKIIERKPKYSTSTLVSVPENNDSGLENKTCRGSVLSDDERQNSSSSKKHSANNYSTSKRSSAPGNEKSNLIHEEIRSPDNSSDTSSSSNEGLNPEDMNNSIEKMTHNYSSTSTDSMLRPDEQGCDCGTEEDLDVSGKNKPCACSVSPPRSISHIHHEDNREQHLQATVAKVTYKSVPDDNDMNCGLVLENTTRDNAFSAEHKKTHFCDDGNTGQRHQSTEANLNHRNIHSITDKVCGLVCDSTKCLSSFTPNHKEARGDEDITGKHHQSIIANVAYDNVTVDQCQCAPITDTYCDNGLDKPEQDSSPSRSNSDMSPPLSHNRFELNSSKTPSTETESSSMSMSGIVKTSEQYSKTSYIERQLYENKNPSIISDSPEYVTTPRNASCILPEDLKNAIESIVCKGSQACTDNIQYMCSQEIIDAIEKNACTCRYARKEERSNTSSEDILRAIKESACKCRAGLPEEKPYMSSSEILRQIDDKVHEAVSNSRRDPNDYEVLIRRERNYVDEKIQEIIMTRSEAGSTPVIVQLDKNIDREDVEILLKEERKYVDQRVKEIMLARPSMVSTGTTVNLVPTVVDNTGPVMVSVGTMIEIEGQVDVVKWLHEEYLTLAKDIIESKNMPEGYEGPLSQDNLRLRQENLASLESILVPKLSLGKMDSDKYDEDAKGSRTDEGSPSEIKEGMISIQAEKSSRHTRHESLRSKMSARSHVTNSRSKSLDEGLKKSGKSKDKASSSGELINTEVPTSCQDVCGSVHRSSLKGTRSICLQGKCPSHCPSITWSDSKTIRQEINGHPIDLKVPINDKKHCRKNASRCSISQDSSCSSLNKVEARVSKTHIRDQLNNQYDTNRSSSGFIGRNERSIEKIFGTSDPDLNKNGSKHSAGKKAWRATGGERDTRKSENNSSDRVRRSTDRNPKEFFNDLQKDSSSSVNESTEEVKVQKPESSKRPSRRQYSALSIQRQSAVDIMPEDEIPTNDGHQNDRKTLESNSLMNQAFGRKQRTESQSQEPRVQNGNRNQPGEILESLPTKRRPSDDPTSLKHASSAPQGKIWDDVRYKRRSWSASRPDIWTRHMRKSNRNDEIRSPPSDYGRKEIPTKFSSAEIKFIKPYDQQYLKTINSVSKGDIYLEEGKCGCSVLVQEIDSIPSNSKGDVARCKCSKTDLHCKKTLGGSNRLGPVDSDHQSYAILQYNPTNCRNAACPFSPRREYSANGTARQKICREVTDPDHRDNGNDEDYSSRVDLYEELEENVSETRQWTRDEYGYEELGISTSKDRLAYQVPRIRNRNMFTAQRDSCCSGQPRRESSNQDHENKIKKQYKQFSSKNLHTEVIEGINFSPLFHRLESTAVDCKEKLKNYYQTLMSAIPRKEIQNKKCKGFPIKKSKSGYCIISEDSSSSLYDRDGKHRTRLKEDKQTVWAVVKIKLRPDGTKEYDIMRPKQTLAGDVTCVGESSVMVANVGSGRKRRSLSRNNGRQDAR